MRFRSDFSFICVVTAAFLSFVVGVGPAHCTVREKPLAPESAAILSKARKTAERGLLFLETDAAKWRKEHVCASCHQGTMTVWALCEAKSQGYSVNGDSMADVVKWHKERLKDIDKPRDARPGWNMVSTPAVYLAVMARAVPMQEAVTVDELKQIAGHLVRHQEDGGFWAWSLAPAQNRPPPVLESDEVVTLLGCMALGPHVPANAKEESPARTSRDRAAAWLAKTEPGDSTQAAAFRLLVKVWGRTPARALKKEIELFQSRQREDGGWGQLRDLPSDAYATGQALYALGLAGVKSDREAIQRGVAFLIANQKDDGSWPMTSRAQPGAKPFKNPSPITYFGSAWATLGLMRSAPEIGSACPHTSP